jgi:hypothetical protein
VRVSLDEVPVEKPGYQLSNSGLDPVSSSPSWLRSEYVVINTSSGDPFAYSTSRST